MTTMFKTMTVLGALSVGGLGLGEAAWAADTATTAQQPGIDCPGPGGGWGMRGGAGRQGGMGFRGRFDPDRELSADQVRVITEAHLIRMGQDTEYKVGEIKESTAKTFTVQLLNADGSVARTMEMTRNGMPMGRPK